MFMPVKIAICPDKYLALFIPTSILQSLIVDFEILLSAKHRNPHSNSLRHNSSDDSTLVTSPLIHFLLPPVAIQPLLQA